MLLLFRKIRNNAIHKRNILVYLGYAVGEILLVVIGILIAVYIDNQNEIDKQRQVEIENYKDIIADLQKDSVKIDQQYFMRKLTQEAVYHLFYEIQGKRSYVDSIKYELLGATISFKPRTEKNHQNTIAQLENKDVRNLLNDYFSIQNSVLESVAEYNDIVFKTSRPFFFDKLVIDAKKVFHDDMMGFFPADGSISENSKLQAFYNDPQFVQMLAKLRLANGRVLVEMREMQKSNHRLVEVLSRYVAKKD